jgi:hypothetical protein
MLAKILKNYPTAAPVAFLVLMILLPYWKLTTMQGFVITDDIFTSDIMNEGFPYRHYISEALKNGELPTWLPYIYGGIPLLARAEAGVCYPLNLLLFGVLPPYVALNVVILITLLTAALGMYLYARELDAGIVPALLAAVAFAYSGFVVSHIKHLSMVGTVCWFALGLLIIERAVKRSEPKIFLWLGIVFGLQNLSGHIQTAYYAGLVYIAYFLFRLLSTRKEATTAKRKSKEQVASRVAPLTLYVSWFLTAMILAVGISAVQLIPTYELVGLTQRSGGVTFDYAASYAYDPSNIKTFFYPYANGDIGNATYRGESIFWEDYGYVGVIPLVLAMYGAIKCWRKWHVKFFVVAAVVAYAFVLGPNTPLYEAAFHIVPGMKFFRFPTRCLFVVEAALAILAAIGMTQLFASRRDPRDGERSDRRLEYALLIVTIGDLLFFQLRQNPIVNAQQWLAPPATVQRLKEDASLFRIFSPGGSETHKAAFAAAQGWAGSLQPYIDQREFVQGSSNVLYGLFSADGYAQLTPNYVVDIWGDQNRSGIILRTASLTPDRKFMPRDSFHKLMNLFNVKYLISPWEISSRNMEFVQQNGSALLYRNPTVLPRAFVVSKYKFAPNPESAKAMLISDEFDPAREVIVYETLPFVGGEDSSRASAVVERYGTNEVVVNVSSASGCILILSDTFYPGWNAERDGVETKIYQANVCQRAVVVPGGKQTVRFRFASSSVMWGFVLSAGSFVALVAIAFVGRRKKL